MSKKLILFLVLGFIFSFSRAQVLIGPTAGMNISWVSFDNEDSKKIHNQTPVIGYHAGATVSFRVRNRFFLNTSILYSTKGKNLTRDNDDKYISKFRLSYIEMPISYTAEFKGSFKKGKEFKWYLGVGPNISYWLGGKGEFQSSPSSEIFDARYYYDIVFYKHPSEIKSGEMGVQNPNRVQLGLNLSAGLVLEPLGLHKMMLVVRYELGHTFLSGESQGAYPTRLTYSTEDMKLRNQGFRISLSYLFDLKTNERKKGKSTIKKKDR